MLSSYYCSGSSDLTRTHTLTGRCRARFDGATGAIDLSPSLSEDVSCVRSTTGGADEVAIRIDELKLWIPRIKVAPALPKFTVDTHTFWAKYPYILRGILSIEVKIPLEM